ncbi:MAG: hypothetical protein AAF531_08880 [Actinomycetota bacterium]
MTVSGTNGGDPGIRLHRRQYVVGPRPCRISPDWVVVELDRGLVISHCPDLQVAHRTDRDGTRWTVIGLTSQTRSDRPDPLDDLAEATTAAVQSVYEGWAGRWTVIGAGELHLDATAQLACHWFSDDQVGTWATSSPAILNQLLGNEPDRTRQPVYARGLSWIVPPDGNVARANRLFPSQILDLLSGGTRWRRLVVPALELDIDASDEGAAQRGFITALGHSIARLPAREPKHIGLTAGADSRLVLAAALSAGVAVHLYTRRAARMSVADRLIPARLAAAVGVEHRELLPGRTDDDRVELARAHTGWFVSDGDALPFVQGVRDHFVGIEIGGQGLGVGKMKMRNLPAEIDDPAGLANRVADHLSEQPGTANRPALARWLAAVAAHQDTEPDHERVDWRDRFYMEQRAGGWQAAKEQLYDLHRHHRFFPVNSARTIGWLFAIDPTLRSTGRHRRELIALADDRLLAEPFNPAGNAFPRRTQIAHAVRVDRRGLAGRVGRRLGQR